MKKLVIMIKKKEKFLSKSMNAPLLSKEQEQSLTKLWKKTKLYAASLIKFLNT